MRKEDKYVDVIVNEITDKLLDATSFKEILELMPHGELTKEVLVKVIDCYDIYTVYHMIFDLFGHELCKEEYKRGIESLNSVDYKVDYIITHTAPNTALEMLKYTLPPKERTNFVLDPHDMQLRSYLDMVWHNTDFKRWYFGHWHQDKHLTNKARMLLFDVEIIE